jgi:transcriptional regulator with XRE-family HTH domain
MVDKESDTEKLAKRLGKRIATRRKSLGWTQDALAERMEVDSETISRFERGAHLPSLPTLERLAIALRVEVGELLSRRSVTQVDSATALAAWMEGLSTADKEFVLSVARDCCSHLRKRTTGRAARRNLEG